MQDLLAHLVLSVQWAPHLQICPHALQVPSAQPQQINVKVTVRLVPRVISAQTEQLRLAIVRRDLSVPSVPIMKPHLLALLELRQLLDQLRMPLLVLQRPALLERGVVKANLPTILFVERLAMYAKLGQDSELHVLLVSISPQDRHVLLPRMVNLRKGKARKLIAP